MTAPRRRATIYHDLAELYAELAILEDQYESVEQVNGPPVVLPRTDAETYAAPQGLQPLRAVDAHYPDVGTVTRPQVYTPPPPPQASPGPSPVLDVNIATHCPKHGTEYRRGNYGPYCPNQTDDPAFADRKGYCNLPGQNANRALAWIAVQKGANGVR